MADGGGFTTENNGRFEPLIIKYVCEPALELVPRSVHPNTISIFNHFLAWSTFIALAVAPMLSPNNALAARLWGGFGLILSMVLDCLDGMQARRTGQSSKVGEVLDHWFDAINVPLAGAAAALTLQLDVFATGLIVAAPAILYNWQLVIYHNTRRFIHPSTSGTEGQTMGGLLMIALGVLLYLFPRDIGWVGYVCLGIGWVTILLTGKFASFYVSHLKGMWRTPLIFVGVTVAFSALHVLGLISALACVLSITFVSFRINGSYVLYTVARRSYSGVDWFLVVWLAGIVGAGFFAPVHFRGGYTLQMLVPYLGLLYIAAANLFDFARQLPTLRGGGEGAHSGLLHT